jgi:O-antigen/teichoic acid export membrane protein
LSLSFKEDVFKEIFGFSVYTSINIISANIVIRLDKAIVSFFLGNANVTYYSIPYTLSSTISSFIGNINQFIFPFISHLKAKEDIESLKIYFTIYLRYTAFVSSFIVSIYIIFVDYFIGKWMGIDFLLHSRLVGALLGFTFFFSCLSSVSLWYFFALGKSNVNLISSLAGSISYLVLSLILIPKFGIIGAAMAFMVIILPFPFYNYYLCNLINIRYISYLKVVLPYILIVIAALLYTLIRPISTAPTILDISFSTLIIILLIFFNKDILSELWRKMNEII